MPPSIRRIFLIQGAVYCGMAPAEVSTVLGSCVSVCLWDQRLRAGGINHYVLPEEQGESDSENTRYGNVAIDHLYQAMLDLGCRPGMLQAKIFGGASVFPLGSGQVTVGERNVVLALERMRGYRIPVVAQHTGGKSGRQIVFHTGTGAATIRNLRDEPASAAILPAVVAARS